MKCKNCGKPTGKEYCSYKCVPRYAHKKPGRPRTKSPIYKEGLETFVFDGRVLTAADNGKDAGSGRLVVFRVSTECKLGEIVPVNVQQECEERRPDICLQFNSTKSVKAVIDRLLCIQKIIDPENPPSHMGYFPIIG
jgi:hypothetical protein